MELIFVYNADSGLMNTLIDIGHKIISPQTYQCQLCALTYGWFFERKQWQKFRKKSAWKMQFLHRDEFEQQYRCQFDYPVVLRTSPSLVLQVIISAAEFDKLTSLEQLITQLTRIND